MPSDFERAVDLIHETLADPTVWKGMFRIAEDEHTPVRRIVWMPRSYDSRPTKYTNPRHDLSGQVAKVIGVEVWTVEAHASAESFEALELLRARLLSVIRKLFGTDSTAGGGHWTTQEQNVAGVMWAAAEKCVMTFQWSFNVVERTTPVTVKHIETTTGLGETSEGPFVIDAPPELRVSGPWRER